MKIANTLMMGAVALAAIGAMGTAALADATVTSSVSISSTGGPNGARQHSGTVTVYYQGDTLRIESANGPAMVYTGGKLYRINTADQTYCQMPSPPKHTGMPPHNNDKFSLTATGQTSSVAGQSATQYTVSGTGPAGPPPRPQQSTSTDSGNGGDDAGGPPSGPPPSASMTGQIWLSDSVKIDSRAKDALEVALGQALGVRGPLGHALAAKLLAMGDAPLSANITITMPAMPDGTQPTMTLKSNVTSVSTSTLDSSLFAIPTGYTQVQAQQGGPGGGPNDQARNAGPGGGGGPGDDFGGGGPGGGGPGGGGPGD